ncbi:hypothetical protein NIES2104_51720 [Leptolyngbya sp. NIES-2104]|nr:hypothetical protein NIES2104_51720 [Leptolyngbya sp. NIES-2104]
MVNAMNEKLKQLSTEIFAVKKRSYKKYDRSIDLTQITV